MIELIPSDEKPNDVEGEMGKLMLGMEGDTKRIGQYYHELTYADPKTGENIRVFFLKSGGSDGGYVIDNKDGSKTTLPPKDFGVYVSKKGLFLCASPTHSGMISAIESGRSELVKQKFDIVMIDHSTPSNEKMSGAVDNAFIRSRQPYLERVASQQQTVSRTISLAQNLTSRIAGV